jgi:hypothetical protein
VDDGSQHLIVLGASSGRIEDEHTGLGIRRQLRDRRGALGERGHGEVGAGERRLEQRAPSGVVADQE